MIFVSNILGERQLQWDHLSHLTTPPSMKVKVKYIFLAVQTLSETVTMTMTITNTNTKTMTNTFREHLQRAILETCDL